jgi:hypothetical protein
VALSTRTGPNARAWALETPDNDTRQTKASSNGHEMARRLCGRRKTLFAMNCLTLIPVA